MMYTEVIRYEEVARKFTRSNPCPGCTQKVRRQRTFRQTINPFNKTGPDRHVKTWQEIWNELGKEGQEWQSQSSLCSRCLQSVE